MRNPKNGIKTIFALSLIILFTGCKKEIQTPADAPIPDAPVLSQTGVHMVLKSAARPVGDAVEGYYVGLPSNYDSVTTKYPVLIYLPGAGQLGNGTTDLHLLLNDGPAKLINESKFPVSFTVNGQTSTMIVFNPQFKWYPSNYGVKACIDFVKQNLRVDESRIYLSGLSMGGILSTDVGSEIPTQIAAIVPMSGTFLDYNSTTKCQSIAQGKLPVWAFHSKDDPQFDVEKAKAFISKVNSYNPVIPAKIKVWSDGGHDSWTRALNPMFRENGLNIYEWMLQYHR